MFYTLVVVHNYVVFQCLALMDAHGRPPSASGAVVNDASLSNPRAMGSEFRPHGSNIPPTPFFGGFPHPATHMPFLFQQPFMPFLPSMGISPATQGNLCAPVDLTAGSHKRDSLECVPEQSKPTKKRRVAQKKPEIIQLDDVKDEIDVVKSGGHWKDHWVIQLMTIRGEMHSTFSTPPKQGEVINATFTFSSPSIFL